MLAGRLSAGGVVSRMVTLNESRPWFPCASVAEHCTRAVPSAKVDPEAGVQVTATLPSTVSVALAVNVTTLPLGPVASAVMSSGAVTAGPIVSTTRMRKLPVIEPSLLVAVQETVLVPSGKTDPDGGV